MATTLQLPRWSLLRLVAAQGLLVQLFGQGLALVVFTRFGEAAEEGEHAVLSRHWRSIDGVAMRALKNEALYQCTVGLMV